MNDQERKDEQLRVDNVVWMDNTITHLRAEKERLTKRLREVIFDCELCADDARAHNPAEARAWRAVAAQIRAALSPEPDGPDSKEKTK